MVSRNVDDGELDRLLGQARWPQPSSEQIARLGQHWRAARRRRRRLLLTSGALAASVLIAAGILGPRYVRPPQDDAIVQERVSKTHVGPGDRKVQSQVGSATNATSHVDRQSLASRSTPRDPNLYERILLMGAASERPSRPRRAMRQDMDRALEEVIGRLASDDGADVGDQLALLEMDLPRCERRLWGVIAGGDARRRLGAARLLARIGTSQSLAVLVQLASDPATRETATLRLGRLAGTRDLARMAATEPPSATRRKLLAMLLERRTVESVGCFLDFVNQGDSAGDALEVLADLADPPVDILLAYLESPQLSQRLVAAQSLARLPDPQIASRLSQIVLEGVSRQEALVALLLSHNAQAGSFVNQARHDLYLAAAVRAAEQQLHSLEPARGGNLQ